MMHLHMIGIAVAIAFITRLFVCKRSVSDSWQTRWQTALLAFVVPPLFLMATAVAILAMGNSGAPLWEGWLSSGLALGFGLFAVGTWSQLIWSAIAVRRRIHQYPCRELSTTVSSAYAKGTLIETPVVFSAQVGLWSSELVVSQGLLDHLDPEHLEAVLAHESGHAHYRDTFWFFWLGGLKRLTGWLPHSEALWQELLLLREVRADRWAARRVDGLVLAESLLSVITAPLAATEAICAGFSCAAPRSRLAQRVDALLSGEEVGEEVREEEEPRWFLALQWSAIALSLSPLMTIPFHH